MSINYLQLAPGTHPPDIAALKPFLAVVVIEEEVSSEWRDSTSDWLVKSGCMYMMAWGANCSEWDDAVDMANIQLFNSGDIPEDELVVTTWDADDALSDVFHEAKDIASHSCVELSNTLILHISAEDKAEEFLALYFDA
jgi:hypothetical protein